MSMQETYLNEKEEEIVTLTNKLEDITDKYDAMLKVCRYIFKGFLSVWIL